MTRADWLCFVAGLPFLAFTLALDAIAYGLHHHHQPSPALVLFALWMGLVAVLAAVLVVAFTLARKERTR